MLVSKYLIQRLQQINCTEVFSYPSGEHSGYLLQEFSKNKSTELIIATNEQESGFSAHSYSKLSGVPSVLLISFGQNSTKTINSVTCSYHEFSPVIVINVTPPHEEVYKRRDQGRLWNHSTDKDGGLYTDMDLFSKITCHSERISNCAMASTQIDNAFTSCLTFKRPVYIEIMEDVLTQKCSTPSHKIQRLPLQSNEKELNKSMEFINAEMEKSKYPLIWLGPEVQRYSLIDDFMKFIESKKLFFFTSLNSKGNVDEGHENFLGVFTGKSSSKYLLNEIMKSDLILILGEISTEIDSIDQSIEFLNEKKRCIITASHCTVKNTQFYSAPVTLHDLFRRMQLDIPQSSIVHSNERPSFDASYNCDDPITYDSLCHQIDQSNLINEESILVADSSLVIFPASNIQGNHYNNLI
jgi:indolepyruvate decarboxylase